MIPAEAAEQRQKMARGVSRGFDGVVQKPRPGRQMSANKIRPSVAAPQLDTMSSSNPRLAPWATFWRNSVAGWPEMVWTLLLEIELRPKDGETFDVENLALNRNDKFFSFNNQTKYFRSLT